jgi:hypothetical protein
VASESVSSLPVDSPPEVVLTSPPPSATVNLLLSWTPESGKGWELYMPKRVVRKSDMDFVAMVSISDSEETLFSVDVSSGNVKYPDVLAVRDKMVQLLAESATISTEEYLSVNGNTLILLDTISSKDNSTLNVHIYLSVKNDIAYIFSCGGMKFTDNSKLVCRQIMNTLLLK